MLVEFIGFSSSGKTRLIKEVSLNLKEKEINFNNIELEFLNKRYPSKLSKQYFSLLLNCKTIFLFLFRFFDFNKIKNILSLLKLAHVPLFRKISYFRNYIKKISLVNFYIRQRYKNHKKILLFDEGFIQGILNVLNHINNDGNSLNLESIELDYYPNVLICLKPNTNELVEKIKKRNNRKHWSSLSDKELKFFIDRFNMNMEKVINFYKKSKKKKVLIISENNFNTHLLINFLIKELKINN